MKPKVLFVASEAHPLIKTGGLADVCGSLPPALRRRGMDVHLLMPAYFDALSVAGTLRAVAEIPVPRLGAKATLLQGRLPGTQVPVWLIDYPPAFGRAGHPYLDANGTPWYDNAARFALLAEVAVAIARGEAGIDWRPDLVHCHDWQTGLVPALLTADANRPATVFTIHNLAYQGVFPATTLAALGLPASLWSIDALEFYGSLSFIKGGIAFADRVNTVSPTYAREIQTPAFGLGLDGLLRARADRMSGILNGIDVNAWNPARDRFITKPYSAKSYRDKAPNKSALQTEMGLPRATVPLFGLVGRLVEQKGIDLVLDAWPTLADTPSQLVVLGTGERTYEAALTQLAARFPDRVAVKIGYDEALAHRIEAGADVFLMPSRFEPCGLNQMYSLRYGTVPIVRRVGGLADTVVDVAASKQATGFVFDAPTADGLRQTVQRALALYHDAPAWQRLALNGMRQDFSWDRSADEYVALYRRALADRGA